MPLFGWSASKRCSETILNRVIANRPWQRTLLICVSAAILQAPANLMAFAIKFEFLVHQIITKNGLNPLQPAPELGVPSPKFELTLDTGAKVSFSIASIEEIIEHNVATDDLQGPLVTRLHFDSEDLAGGSDRLIRLRQQIVFNLADAVYLDFSSPDATTERQVRVTNSRALLGRALHTLQDFYAHTNWVERHNFSLTEIDARLGNAIVPSPSPGAGCDSSEPEVAPLTSGWFLDDPELAYCGAPESKCAHGSVGCGIHKDLDTRTGFAAAEALAIKATNTYTRETLQAVLAGYTRLVPELGTAAAKQAVRLAICEFMGVPNSTSTCLTSHTITVQKLNQADGSPVTGGLVESSGNTVTPAINCGLLCEGTAIAGTTVVLTAKDSVIGKFVRWAEGGVCAASTNRECSFTVDGNKTAKAEFFNDEFGFEVAESPEPWSLLNPRLRCYHYEGEYQITGYYASFDRCYAGYGFSAVIRCVGSGCSSSRFKVAISKSILSGTVVEGGAACDWRQDPWGADPGSAQNYVQGSGWWFALGQGWTTAWPSSSAINPLAGSFIMQNFSWIGGAPPGLECRGNMTAKLELEFNVYDSTTGTYTKIPFVMDVP